MAQNIKVKDYIKPTVYMRLNIHSCSLCTCFQIGEEILVWYGPEYGKELGIFRDEEGTKTKETANKKAKMVIEGERKSRSINKTMSAKVRETNAKRSSRKKKEAAVFKPEINTETDLEDAVSEEMEDDGSDWGPAWSDVRTSDLDFTTDDDDGHDRETTCDPPRKKVN